MAGDAGLRGDLAARGWERAGRYTLAGQRPRPRARLYPGASVMNVAILGTRGIPASYSGFETAVEQITSRLTARGHTVTVYCRPHVVDPGIREWKGAKLVHLPTVRNKYLDTFVHTLLSSVHASRRVKPDVALFFIAGNSPLCLVTRAAGIPTVINVDGLDSDRRKWNRVAKSYLRAAERLSPRLATRAITDSHAVARIYESRYGRGIGVVPYGAELPEDGGSDVLERLGLEPRRYVLFVGRLEPENNPHMLVEAWSRIPSAKTKGMKLVVVGGAPYASEYINRVRRAADPRVVFPGYVFGSGYWQLQRNAYLFCAPTEVGGTHPVILESLVAGNCVLVNDYEPNAETVGDAGVYFSGRDGVPDLTRQLERLLDQPDVVDGYRGKARERAALYSWDAVAVRVRAAAARRVGGQRPRAAADGAPRRAGAGHRPGRRLLARRGLGLRWRAARSRPGPAAARCAAASSRCWRVCSAWVGLDERPDAGGRRVDRGRGLQRLRARGAGRPRSSSSNCARRIQVSGLRGCSATACSSTR